MHLGFVFHKYNVFKKKKNICGSVDLNRTKNVYIKRVQMYTRSEKSMKKNIASNRQTK